MAEKEDRNIKKRILHALVVSVLVPGMALPLATPAMAATVTFTGNVTVDFVGPGILIIPDPIGDVGMPGKAPPGAISGWDMEDLRLTYDAATDTLYVGINTPRIAGDADGDGDPGGTSAWLAAAGGTDNPNLSGTETIAVYFDLNQDGSFDVIAGVPGMTDITGFTVAGFDGNAYNPALAFGTPLPANTGSYYANPGAAASHFEFTILNFSTLPGQDGMLGSFEVWAFMGSLHDDGIGEDYIKYQQSPNTIASISSSASQVVSGSTVSLTVTEYNAGDVDLASPRVAVTKGGMPLATLVSPPDSGDDGDGILNPGETWSWTISSGVITTTTEFAAIGSGIAPGGFQVTFPDDPSQRNETTVETSLTQAGIRLRKLVDGEDADGPTGPVAEVGSTVIFDFVVTNTGDVDLAPVVVTDNVLGNVGTISSLSPGESQTLSTSATALAGQHSNIATATGTSPIGVAVSDTAGGHYYGSVTTAPPGSEPSPISRPAIVALWILLTLAIIAGAVMLVRRRGVRP